MVIRTGQNRAILIVVPDYPTFAADRMLGRLARWMRLLGADVRYDPALDGAAMLRCARADGRFLLTRDKRLKASPIVLLVRSNHHREQLREVIARFGPLESMRPLSRCSRCNEPLQALSAQAAARLVHPYVYASQDRFACCTCCGRIYWNASHVERIRRELTAL